MILSIAPVVLAADLLAAVRAADCAREAEARLTSWQARVAEAEADPPVGGTLRVFRVPTGEIGVWIRVAVADRAIDLLRFGTDTVDRVTFAAGCAPQVDRRTLAPEIGRAPRFTDDDLRAAAAAGPGVVYLWSPHMPLSVDGLTLAARAAAEEGVQFIPVLDPNANEAYARVVAESRGFPARALARGEARELSFRGMATHAPSLLVFARDRVTGPPLRGYRSTVDYRAFIATSLRGSP